MAVETKNKTGLSLCMLNAVLPGMEVVIIRGHSEKEVRLEISKSLEKNKKKRECILETLNRGKYR